MKIGQASQGAVNCQRQTYIWMREYKVAISRNSTSLDNFISGSFEKAPPESVYKSVDYRRRQQFASLGVSVSIDRPGNEGCKKLAQIRLGALVERGGAKYQG